MEDNRDLARGLLRGADGRMRAKRLWEDLCNSLNALGGCTKSDEQWQRVWADKKHLTKKAAGAARKSACATGGGPSNAPTLSQIEMRVLAVMGEGFGEPQTEARVPAFPSIHIGPISLEQQPGPADTSPAYTSADNYPALLVASPPSQEQPTICHTEPLELQGGSLTQRTINSRRVRRVRRHLPADSARRRIIELEEQRLQAEVNRNEQLGLIQRSNEEIRDAILELCNLVREYITRNN